jgi:putative selenium metabolism protein SsnA
MLIINSIIVTWGKPNVLLSGFAVHINETIIDNIGKQSDLIDFYATDEIIDAKGQYLMPGLICAHTHFYGAFSRGMNIHGSAPADFPEILEKLWWPLDQSLTLEDVKYSALACMIDAIKHGTTTLFDHHASPNAITGSLDVIEKSFLECGLRGVVCYEVTDRGGVNKAEEGIAENVRMIKKLRLNEPSKRKVSATFGMHASLTLSEETLLKCKQAIPTGSGTHIHVAEHSVDEFDSLTKKGLRVVDRLAKHNLLGENSIVVHGVHLDMREVELLAETQTFVTHQPRSNMNNAVGMADVESMLRMGIPVCLGNDGFSNAMWDEWRSCYLAHKLWSRDPRIMNGTLVTEMAIYNNSKLASKFFEGAVIGKIEVGAKADLILVDYLPPTSVTTDNLPWHILFGFRDSMVTTTIVDGVVLMKDKNLVSIDEKNILSNAVNLSKEVWKRYEKQFS